MTMNGVGWWGAIAIAGLLVFGTPATPAAAQVSPLPTREQLAHEAVAVRVLRSKAMRAEIARLRALYAADPRGATPDGHATIRRAADSIAMASVWYAIAEDSDRPAVLWVCSAPHQWFGLEVPGSGFGIENPDNVYRQFMVDGRANYQLQGRIEAPGPAELHIEVRDSIPGTGAMNNEGGTSVAFIRSDSLKIAADGSFTITLDSDAAEGRTNHLQLPPSGHFLVLVRDLLADWSAEQPVALSVRRLSGPPAGAPRGVAALAQRAAELLSQLGPYWLKFDNQFIYTKPVNTLSAAHARPGGRGASTSGHFSLARDEALVVTLDPLGAKSLGIQLTDPWGVAYEYVNHTSSLNSAQARPNSDGTYTFVISPTDPGVYNWLDPAGHGSGMLAARWQVLPGDANVAGAVRDVQLVRQSRLHEMLPVETRFVSSAERRVQKLDRRRAYARRLGGRTA